MLPAAPRGPSHQPAWAPVPTRTTPCPTAGSAHRRAALLWGPAGRGKGEVRPKVRAPRPTWLVQNLLGTSGHGAGAGGGHKVTILPPYCSHTCILWRALAVEPSLTAQVLELLLQKMSRDVPFKESRAFLLSSCPGRVATLLPLAVSGGPGQPPRSILPLPHWEGPHRWPGHRPAGTWRLAGPGAQPHKGLAGVGPLGRLLCFILRKKNKPGLAGSVFSSKAAVRIPSSALLQHQEQMVRPVPRWPHAPVPTSCPRGPSWA